MKIALATTSDPSVRALRDGICEVADRAFQAIPRSEVLRRFDDYPVISVALDGARVRGFLFASWHEARPHHYMGFRLTAVDPDWQGRGVLSRLSTRVFVRYYLRFFTRKLLRLRVSDRLYCFGRVCSPIAYKTLHIGQRIYPDLIGRECDELPAEVRARYTELADLAGLTGLDARTGLLPDGAANAGLAPGGRDISVEEGWATPWNRYVTHGSELLVLFPVGLWFPLWHCRNLLRMGLQRLRR